MFAGPLRSLFTSGTGLSSAVPDVVPGVVVPGVVVAVAVPGFAIVPLSVSTRDGSFTLLMTTGWSVRLGLTCGCAMVGPDRTNHRTGIIIIFRIIFIVGLINFIEVRITA